MNNPNKTISANSKGIIISFRDVNKHKYIPYQSKTVESIQQYGKVKYQQLEQPVFNRTQQKLYSEVLYGLDSLKPAELQELTHKRKFEIMHACKRVKHYLNKLKQEIVDKEVNDILSVLFPHSAIAKHMCSVTGYNRNYISKLSFKELGLTQQKIAEKLVEAGFLPANFFQLA